MPWEGSFSSEEQNDEIRDSVNCSACSGCDARDRSDLDQIFQHGFEDNEDDGHQGTECNCDHDRHNQGDAEFGLEAPRVYGAP